MSKGDRSVTLDVVKNSLWVEAKAYTTMEEARNSDASLVAPVVHGLPEELSSSSGPTTLQAPARGTEAQMWRRGHEREAIERRHLDEEALLDRRRRVLESAINPTVPKTLKGPDAPTESERTAREIAHLQHRDVKTRTLGRGIEAPHVRLTPLEDERPTIAMDFAVREAQADDGKADNLGTFLAVVDSSTGCMRAIASDKRSHRLPCKLSGRLRENMFVGRFRFRCDNEPSIMAVAERAKMPDRVVVKTTPRHSSPSNGLAVGEQLRTLRYDTQNRYKTRITPDSPILSWKVRGTLCHEIRTCSGWHHALPGSA